jgi:hypothetical protein
MDPKDTESFFQSYKAQTIPELVAAVRLWEDHFLVTYRGPFFLIRVADVLASLHSSTMALMLYKEVHSSSSVKEIKLSTEYDTKAQASMEADPVFNEFLEKFEERCRDDDENQSTANCGRPVHPSFTAAFV